MQMMRNWLLEIAVAIAIAGTFGVGLVAFAQIEPPKDGPRHPIPIRVIDVKDGDTVVVDILLPWDVTLRSQDLRENSYDAWESSKRRHSSAVGGEISDAEVAKGKLATAYLKTLLSTGTVFVETPPIVWEITVDKQAGNKAVASEVDQFGSRDVYGRVLAKLWLQTKSGWIDVGAEMTRLGHVRAPP